MKDIDNSVGNNETKSSAYTVLSYDIVVSDTHPPPPRVPFPGVYVNAYTSPLGKGCRHLHFTGENTEAWRGQGASSRPQSEEEAAFELRSPVTQELP